MALVAAEVAGWLFFLTEAPLEDLEDKTEFWRFSGKVPPLDSLSFERRHLRACLVRISGLVNFAEQ